MQELFGGPPEQPNEDSEPDNDSAEASDVNDGLDQEEIDQSDAEQSEAADDKGPELVAPDDQGTRNGKILSPVEKHLPKKVKEALEKLANGSGYQSAEAKQQEEDEDEDKEGGGES